MFALTGLAQATAGCDATSGGQQAPEVGGEPRAAFCATHPFSLEFSNQATFEGACNLTVQDRSSFQAGPRQDFFCSHQLLWIRRGGQPRVQAGQGSYFVRAKSSGLGQGSVSVEAGGELLYWGQAGGLVSSLGTGSGTASVEMKLGEPCGLIGVAEIGMGSEGTMVSECSQGELGPFIINIGRAASSCSVDPGGVMDGAIFSFEIYRSVWP